MDIYIALIHHPVRNRAGETVATAVTNLDIHDLARTARTYDVRGYFVVTPIAQQRSLVERIVSHWQEGEGKAFNPVRARAFERVRVAPDVDHALEAISAQTGHRPLTVVTGAAFKDDTISYDALRARLIDEDGAALILFGTGWGITDSLVARCDLRLPGLRAVPGRDSYNHLSVRSAVSIVLDRLLGDR